jgi:hypothetical protein
MIAGVQPKILLHQDENGNLKITDEQAKLLGLLTQPKPNWKLVREQDGLIKHSSEVTWIEWNEDGKFKAQHEEIAINCSLLMSPFNQFFTWETTPVTEILEIKDNYIKFKTRNSNYVLYKI